MFGVIGVGRILLVDRAYDNDSLRETLRARGAWANIRPMPNRVAPQRINRWANRQRNQVDPFLNKLKHVRAIAIRYDKRDEDFLASGLLTSIRIWLRRYELVT